jgi:hypothetical protein
LACSSAIVSELSMTTRMSIVVHGVTVGGSPVELSSPLSSLSSLPAVSTPPLSPLSSAGPVLPVSPGVVAVVSGPGPVEPSPKPKSPSSPAWHPPASTSATTLAMTR